MIQQRLIEQAEPVAEFKVAGLPLGQGSKIAIVSGKRVKRGGEVWVRNPTASLIEQANRPTKTREKDALKRWRERIAGAAEVARPCGELITGPVVLQCEFVFPRKDEHFKKSGGLKSTAPKIPGTDLDKLFRAVGDSLSGVVYKDDRQITGTGNTIKRFGTANGKGGVYVRVWRDEL